ncbi:MAG: transcriptional regulator [Verrucomicrobia bacterium GWF2_51_19]|nr:MAG: transcriptional regulator [Verrucomicrobia bacterium GWF2_51_19]HCJ12256.1 transcriptional regulator [Opitutae bacterium]
MITLEQAFLTLETENEVTMFLKDLCTPAEIKAMQERWRVCQLLYEGEHSYADIHNETGVSITTVGRVARFLKDEQYGGYRAMLEKLAK